MRRHNKQQQRNHHNASNHNHNNINHNRIREEIVVTETEENNVDFELSSGNTTGQQGNGSASAKNSLPAFNSFVQDVEMSNTYNGTSTEHVNNLVAAESSSVTLSQRAPLWQTRSPVVDNTSGASNDGYDLNISMESLSADNANGLSEPSQETSNDILATSAGLTDWLFSSGLLSKNWGATDVDPNSFLVSPIRDFSEISTPPSFSPILTISEEKRDELINFIPELASYSEFTLTNLKIYIEAYWEKFHFQFPIVHRPSFDVEETPGPLLLCIILIGSFYAKASEVFSLAIAVPLRWVIFSSPHFHPPTRVWILQSLLLLEIYEKTIATSRQLHERAHIHHGATLQLIRRGSTLLDSTTALSSDSSDSSTWKRWVESESIKRAVFAAFILDILHTTLFSHGQLMEPHEIRLSLPCDDRVWESMDDRRKLLNKPTVLFLTGLKRILNRERVEVSSELGRLGLLYGLVSLSNHMKLLDVQLSLDSNANLFRGKWQPSLGNAYDFWWDDYDGATTVRAQQGSPSSSSEGPIIRSNRDDYIVHYHFAHTSMHVKRYELHVFCGDRRVLGLTTIRQDYLAAEKYMYNWVKTDAAKQAAFHALKALQHLFLEEANFTYTSIYSISEDVFIHRPMMLAHCALTYWAYAFCLDGPESEILVDKNFMTIDANSAAWKEHEWVIAAESGRKFFERTREIHTADDLDNFPNKNYTVGLLKWVISSFSESKWILMLETCRMLDNCVKRSLGWDRVVENELADREIQVG